jgi:hypothetical protein
MAARTTDQVKQELESERERLGTAVHTLRNKADRAKRKLPIVALALVGVAVAVVLVRRRVSGPDEPVTEKRARLPFLDRD